MKSVDFLKALGFAACLTIAGGAYAQNDAAAGGDANAAAAPAAASPAHAHHMHMHHESKAQRTANRKLAVAVRRALGKTAGIDPSSIVVRTRSGDVTLLGTVSDPTQVDKAGQVAQGVDGVKSVTNKLTYHQP